jgi:hypothetical protein
MVLNRRHIPWAFFTLLASAGFAVLYAANFHPGSLPFKFELPAIFGPVPPVRNTVGGTPLGLLYGTLALLIFLFAAALGIRKKRRLWPLGNPQTWVRAHIWLTILTIPLVLFHCGLKFGGPMTITLMVLYAIVMISGFWGLAMQQFMPRLMTERLPREVVFEQIPHLRSMLVLSAEGLRNDLHSAARAATDIRSAPSGHGHHATAAVAAPSTVDLEKADQSLPLLRRFLDDECLPYLKQARSARHRLNDARVSDDTFRLLKQNVSEAYHDEVDEMQRWCDERRMMDVQTRMQHWLHGWLIFHVPVSFALLVVTLWHAWIALTYL